MSADVKEKLLQLFGLGVGTLASWPSVTQLLGVLPDFSQDVKLGSAAGFIFGSFLFYTKVIHWFAARSKTAWLLIVFLCVTALWFYLNWKLVQMHDVAIEAPNITPERVNDAKLAIWGVAALWATPLSYVGALLGDRIARRGK